MTDREYQTLARKHGAGYEVLVNTQKYCDLCTFFERDKRTLAAFDSKTIHGPWANMCTAHFKTHGIGLGVGVGQRLIYR